jgi:hypothetical protein
MSSNDARAQQARQGHGWFQFTLRTALWMMVVLAVALGWLADRGKLQRKLAEERAEKEALRAARDYGESSLAPHHLQFGSTSSWAIWPQYTGGGEPDEATVAHLSEFLAGEPRSTVPAVSGGLPWGYLGGATILDGTSSTIIFDSSSVLRSNSIFLGSSINVPDLPNRLVTVVQDVGPQNPSSVNDLIQRLADEDATMRASAACTLARLGGGAKEAVPALIGRLQDADATVRFHAAYALGRTRENSPSVVAALRESMADDASGIAAFAAQMLHRLDPSIDVVPRLIELLDHEDAATRRRAVTALMAVHAPQSSASSTPAVEALPRLTKLFSDPDQETRKKAMMAVARMASPADAHAALSDVVKAGPGEDKEVWTLASVLWDRLDRQLRAASSTEKPGK